MAEISLNKIFLFPEKFFNLMKIDENNHDFSYPISVELSLTNRCNFNCIWCSDYSLRNRLGREFDKDVLFKLLRDLSDGGTKGICIEGGGEPLLYPHFNEIIREINRLGMKAGLITNGSIYDYEDLLDMFEWIRISLDVTSAEQMRSLKKYENFEAVMDNIKKMTISRRTTVIGVGYVLNRLNLNGLEEITIKLKNLGVNYFHIRPVIDCPEIMLDERIDISHLKKHESDQFQVLIDAIKENKIKGNAALPCVAHGVTTTITSDGSVYICGRLNIYPWWNPIGNLNKQSFAEIWNGEERRKQMAQLLDRKFCAAHCPECRITKFNIAINDLKNTKTKNFI